MRCTRALIRRLNPLALCALLACGRPAPPPQTAAPVTRLHGMCFIARDPATAIQPVRSQDWLRLLVKLELGRDAIVAVRDCTGRIIQERRDASCRQSEPNEAATPVAIRQASVVERTLDADHRLLWVITHRFADGDGFGPLALAQRSSDGLDVLALGSLRMHTERVKLELWRVSGEAIVMASGESCRASSAASGGENQPAANGGEFKDCRRAVRLFVHRKGALVEAPILDASGRCMQPSPFDLDSRAQQPLAAGLKRTFELTTAIGHDPRQIVIEEHLVVRDGDPNLPLAAAREVQRVEATRFVRVQAGRLYSQQRPLWSQVLPKLVTPNNREQSGAQRAMNLP